MALKQPPVVVFSLDLQAATPGSIRQRWAEYLGHTDAEIFGGDDGARLAGIKEEVLRGWNRIAR